MKLSSIFSYIGYLEIPASSSRRFDNPAAISQPALPNDKELIKSASPNILTCTSQKFAKSPMKFYLVCIFAFILFANFVSAAHYAVGIANDALDGRSANDFQVVLWNPANGIGDNLTDVIGQNGNSGYDNFYMIDCEALDTPCSIGDILNVKIFSYPYSSEENVTITGAGFDIASNITLNSVPTTEPVFPVDFSNLSIQTINFNCTFNDLDSNTANVSLYGNWSGGWHLNETKTASGASGSVLFSKNLSEGLYSWGCFVNDDLSVSSFSENNFTLTVDRTKPVVNSLLINETLVCGTANSVRITCNTNDSAGIDRVIIEAENPVGSFTNHTANFLSGDDYYSDIPLNTEGLWNFNCFSYDYANNSENVSESFEVYPDSPDLVFSSSVNFSNYNPVEDEEIIVSATISNHGCSNADNFLVGFFEGEPETGNQVGENQTISILSFSNYSVNISWNAKIGPTNLFAFADVGNSINEFNESNNKINKTIDVGVWQEFYGNVTGMKILSDASFDNLSIWQEGLNLQGNVFMADTESNIDWSSLVAIGRDKYGNPVGDDFSEIDSFLGTGNFKDSIEKTFTSGGEPILTKDFFINNKNVTNVPVINSTNNSNFMTGILWDSSDDSDGEYGGSNKEDIVFVAQLNKNSLGSYGTYDYELAIPVSLRDYYSNDTKDVYFYYDLV